MINKTIALVTCLILANLCYSQTQKETALQKGREAIQLEDSGRYADALRLLSDAEKLDPGNYNYPYEMGYCYYAQKEYKKALTEYQNVVRYKDADDQCFQMLSNTYDVLGDSLNALKAYDDGLKLFPKSGKLFLEKGNSYWGREQYSKALSFYEKGIQADPKFSSNYYRATRIYCSTSEKIWGVLYGEIFMNLERNSDRTREISKLLFKTYKASISVTSDSSGGVDFSKDISMGATKEFKMPFQLAYGFMMTLSLSTNILAKEKEISLASIDNIRTNFIKNWFLQKKDKEYPNVLFSFNQSVLNQGHLEAYNHWIFMEGDEDEFMVWHDANKEKWNSFVDWFSNNKIQIDDNHKFSSSQY